MSNNSGLTLILFEETDQICDKVQLQCTFQSTWTLALNRSKKRICSFLPELNSQIVLLLLAVWYTLHCCSLFNNLSQNIEHVKISWKCLLLTVWSLVQKRSYIWTNFHLLSSVKIFAPCFVFIQIPLFCPGSGRPPN